MTGGRAKLAMINSRFVGVTCAVAWVWAAPAFAAPCDRLAALVLKDAQITSARAVAAGQFSPPGGQQNGGGAAGLYKALPEFCRVAATLTPTPRLGHQSRSVAADELEHQVPGGRERRMGRHDQLFRAGRSGSRAGTQPRRPTLAIPAAARHSFQAIPKS